MIKSMRHLMIGGASVLAVGGVVLAASLVVLMTSPDGGQAANQWELEPEQQAPVSSMVDQSTISIPGMESMTIPADTETVSVRLYNPEENPCYFEISITLEDGTELYRSKLVSPGQELYEITLNQPLEAGEYSAVLHYSTYSMDESYTPMNGASVPFTLYVTE